MLSIEFENTRCAFSFNRLIPLWHSHRDAAIGRPMIVWYGNTPHVRQNLTAPHSHTSWFAFSHSKTASAAHWCPTAFQWKS